MRQYPIDTPQRLGVTPESFVAHWDEARRRAETAPTSYILGVLAAFRWAAGEQPVPPTRTVATRPTPEELAMETHRATIIANAMRHGHEFGRDWARVDRDHARGAMFALAWLRGRPRAQPPVQLSSPDRQTTG